MQGATAAQGRNVPSGKGRPIFSTLVASLVVIILNLYNHVFLS